MIWWLFLITLWSVSIVVIGKIVNLFALEELKSYVEAVDKRIRQAELAYLSRLPTKSRIKFKPDI